MKADGSVDHQNLAVIAAESEPAEPVLAQRPELDHFDAAFPQLANVVRRQTQRAQRIEEDPHQNSGSGPRAERAREEAAHVVVGENIGFEMNVARRMVDGREHGGKRFLAVDERLEAIAAGVAFRRA